MSEAHDLKTTTAAQRPLARYDAAEGNRVLVAITRTNGSGHVEIAGLLDRPARGEGRSYVVERALAPGDSLKALVADYTAEAAELGHVPMSRAAIAAKLERDLRAEVALS